MHQRLQISSWRGGRDERLWLSALIDAMEEAAQPGRSPWSDVSTLSALRAQLAVPQPRFASPFSLRN